MTTVHFKTNKKSWTLEEDKHLLQLIELHGAVGNWPTIAMEMEYRSGKQCRERYINQLDPLIKKTVWTVEEDEIIKKLHFEIGKKWRRYMDHLPGRSDNAIKNRYHIISKDNYAEHNLHYAASLDTDSAPPPSDGVFVLETAAVRLDRFRCARELLDRKIKALEREKEQLIRGARDDGPDDVDGESAATGDTDAFRGHHQETASLGATSGATTADLSVDEPEETVSGVSSVTTMSSPRAPKVRKWDQTQAFLDDCDTQAYSTVLDEFHFDCEDMCYNDPHGTYDEVMGFK